MPVLRPVTLIAIVMLTTDLALAVSAGSATKECGCNA